MSLIVWLPLDGDLHNQGCSNPNISLVSGNTWASSGKIGNSSLTLTKLQTILPTSSYMTGAKEVSYCYWVKVNTAWSTNWLDGIRWIETDGSATSTARQEFYTNCTLVGTWYKGGSISGKAFTPGVWTHLAATFNYNTGEANFYIDGILKGTTTNINKTYYCRGDFYIGDNEVDICQNDVRIYDHCLSAAEVKEISQGLVLHYKLDSSLGRAQPNLLLGTRMSLSDRTPFVANNNTTWTNYFRYYNGNASLHSFEDSTDTIMLSKSGNLGICFLRSAAEIELDSTSYYTLSCEAKCSKAGAGLDMGLSYYKTDNTWKWRGGTNRHPFSDINQWQTMTLTFKPDSDTQYICYCFTVVGTADGTDTFSIRHCKLEKGSEATPWIPAIEEMNLEEDKIEDSSGYGHNGTITGTSTSSSNTARYSNSLYFGAYQTPLITNNNPSFLTALTNCSVSWWEYITVTTNSLPFVGQSDSYYIGAGSTSTKLYHCNVGSSAKLYRNGIIEASQSFNSSNQALTSGTFTHTQNQWVHFVLSGANLSAWTAFKMNGYSTGWPINGYISDVRIYATALSADDILSLYHTSAKVDNKQNLHTFELVESNSAIQINKRGQTLCNELQENAATKFYKNDQIIETNEIIEL